MEIFISAFKAITRARRSLDRCLDTLANGVLRIHFAGLTDAPVRYHSLRWLPAEYRGRWEAQPAQQLRLSIVIVTYQQPEALECLLASLRCQTLQNFDLLVYHDGAHEPTRRVIDRHKNAGGAPCRYIESPTRYNDYGHTLRDFGIQAATSEFVLITNGDNYYLPRFVEFAFDAIDSQKLDIAIWDIVHSHTNPGSNGNPSNNPFQSYPLRNRIDIGAFLVRSLLARKVGFRNKTHDGDASYMRHLIEESGMPLRIGKIEKTLMVHN